MFGEADFLPAMVFPLVKLFGADDKVSFEAVATLLTNWTRGWFELFPSPPLRQLAAVESLVGHQPFGAMSNHDKHMLNQDKSC